jgi:hypothetical protein
MSCPTVEETTLALLVRNVMVEHGMDLHSIAKVCQVTYQTAKNVADGKSPNARFMKRFIDSFGINKDHGLLRRYLLAYLLLQFPENNGELLRVANLLQK